MSRNARPQSRQLRFDLRRDRLSRRLYRLSLRVASPWYRQRVAASMTAGVRATDPERAALDDLREALRSGGRTE